MTTAQQLANELLEFIYESPTAFHAVLNVEAELKNSGYAELHKEQPWNIERGGKYYLKENDSAIFAFNIGIGEVEREGFRIISSHTDSPSFKLKPRAEINTEGTYITLNTEVYGAPIMSTWQDRPLSVAGRVTVATDNFLPKQYFVNIKRPILIIPNLGIHFNRNVNEGVSLNPQKHMLPLMTLDTINSGKKNYITDLLSSELNIEEGKILDYELFLYEFEKGTIIGLRNEFISSGRLDNLASVHAALKAFKAVKESEAINVLACFDNEEVGSATRQGADSEVLPHALERILLSLGKTREDLFIAYAKSFMISADQAHAVHPTLSEKYDPINRAYINEGPVIKISSAQKYTSDSITSGAYEMLCRRADIPVQKFTNRSDERGGTTIGPIASAHLPIMSVDIGIPILAMHSVRELGGVEDYKYMTQSFVEFFGGRKR